MGIFSLLLGISSINGYNTSVKLNIYLTSTSGIHLKDSESHFSTVVTKVPGKFHRWGSSPYDLWVDISIVHYWHRLMV